MIEIRFRQAHVDSESIFQEVTIKIHNSHLVHAFLYELRELRSMKYVAVCAFGACPVQHVRPCSRAVSLSLACASKSWWTCKSFVSDFSQVFLWRWHNHACLRGRSKIMSRLFAGYVHVVEGGALSFMVNLNYSRPIFLLFGPSRDSSVEISMTLFLFL